MGVWGPGIFSDDIALEIRDAFRNHIGAGGTTEEFMALMRSEERDPGAWLALAATQWQMGRLDPYAKEHALKLIVSGSAMEGWQDNPKLTKQRHRALNMLSAKLLTAPPSPKKVRPKFVAACEWEPADLLAYQLKSGKWIVLHVLSIHRDAGGAHPVVQILEGTYDAPPATLQSSQAVHSYVRFASPDIKPSRIDALLIGETQERFYPKERLQLLPYKLPVRSGALDLSPSGFLWRSLDDDLARIFELGAPFA